MLKVIRVILYILAGFFLCTASFNAFLSIPSTTVAMKLGIMAICGALGLVVILLAMAMGRFTHWKRPLGATLLAVVGMNILMVINFICMEASSEITRLIPNYPHHLFSDYTTGGITTLCLAAAGIALTRSFSAAQPSAASSPLSAITGSDSSGAPPRSGSS